MQKAFKVNLIPKHHFITHYGTLIRLMGPLISMSTIRYESKHQHLERLIETSRNTVNVTKTITKRHQSQLVFKSNTYLNEIQYGKKVSISQSCEFELSLTSNHSSAQKMFSVDWFRWNSYVYRKGLFIYEWKFAEIEGLYIIDDENGTVLVSTNL